MVDSRDNLYAADSGNCRVLGWDDPTSPAATGGSTAVYYGTFAPGATDTTGYLWSLTPLMHSPVGARLDAAHCAVLTDSLPALIVPGGRSARWELKLVRWV